jgi:signal recognition particle receptor subunit beta
LSGLAVELQSHVDEPAVSLLQEAQEQLELASCRIAVIGQIKAGKSTFINALIGHPGLLPSDINSSTAVVTLLNFRKSEAVPDHAAAFRFFSLEDWSDLAEGGRNLGRLTERLVPGFSPQLLRAQLEFMRKRAERRLGADFRELLGQCHCFKEITPELLAEYIGGGDGYEETEPTKRRRYSDITRTAELFLSEGPFSFPVTLIDTPGNNDPFLVRDEITRHCLDSPDIFIFVLSALQPLTAVDISMLRLLSDLHKDRIVVFINRADQLADPVAAGATIKAAVELRLRLEFPRLDIPVIVGSARWGNSRVPADDLDLRAHLEASHTSARGGASLVEGEIGGLPADVDQSRLGRSLYAHSGIPQVVDAVTRLMSRSDTAVMLRQIAGCFLEIAKSTEMSARIELKSIEKQQGARVLEAATLEAKIAEEQDSLRVFDERASALRTTFMQIETHFTELIAAGTKSLRTELRRIVHDFSDEQAEIVLLSQRRGGPARTRACNVVPLRAQLETAYLKSFEQMADDLLRIESILYPQLKSIAVGLISDCPDDYLEPPTVPLQPPASAPLSVTSALDLGEPWWKPWSRTKLSPDQQADHLRKLINYEFAAVAEELAHLAETRLTERVEYTLQRLNVITHATLSRSEQRKALLAEECGADEQSLRRLENELSQRAHTCTETHAACALFGKELTHLIGTLEAVPVETKTPQGAVEPACT